jgi:two-component system sensor histidine kinase KdpD
VLIQLFDDGPGLPPGCEETIFEKFSHGIPPSGAGGIGLGLAIVQTIIELHGGTIQASNRAAGGAAFRFDLPIKQPPFALPIGELNA